MKKVLLISSSPRKDGNSELLCRQFMQGALEAGHQCELLCLRDHNLSPCIACDACRGNRGTCAIQDDAPMIITKFMEADVIVLATPVYFFTMSAQLKIMIDRFRPVYRQIKDKEIYLIATVSVAEESQLERTFESIRGFTELLPGSREKGVICGNSAWEPGDVVSTPTYRKALKMGRNI